MKKVYTKIIPVFTILLLISLFTITSCISVPGAESSKATAKVEEYTLDNGIPVYVKKNTANRIYSLDIIVKGGSNMLTPDKSGLESFLFSMMTKGSKNYSYSKLQNIEYETNISLSSTSYNEGSLLSLNCIDHYFDKSLPILIDGFMNPVYENVPYMQLLQAAYQSIQQKENDPSMILFNTAVKTIFKNHPYETRSGVTKDSIKNITDENLKALHTKLLDSKRISIVAVGNIDGKELVKKLNTTMGTIPALENTFTPVKVPLQKVDGKPVVLTHQSAAGTGFVARACAAPAFTDPDFVPCYIASDIYSDILYNIVREKYGACYTPRSSIYATMSPCICEFIYKVSDLENVTKYMKEARDLMAQGKIIDGKNADGSYKYVPVDDKLEGYINSFINSQYSSEQTNQGVAGKMAIGLIRYNDPAAYDTISAKANAVTASDVERVFKKYWLDGTDQWFAVVGPGEKNKIKF